MLNLLRMNLFRMLRTRSLQVILIVTILFSGFNVYMSTVDIEGDLASAEAAKKEELADASMEDNTDTGFKIEKTDPQEPPMNFGIYMEYPTQEDGPTPSYLEFYCADLSSRILLIFLTIAVVLFFHSEEKTGFVKNIAGQTKHRYYLFLSQLITFVLYQFVLMFAYGLAEFVILKIHYKGELMFGMNVLDQTLPFLGGQFFLYLAFVSGIAAITTLFHSSALGITFGLLSSCGFGAIISGWISKLFDWNIHPWFLTSRMDSLSLEMSTKTLCTALLAGLGYLAAYTLISSIWLTKKDVV